MLLIKGGYLQVETVISEKTTYVQWVTTKNCTTL